MLQKVDFAHGVCLGLLSLIVRIQPNKVRGESFINQIIIRNSHKATTGELLNRIIGLKRNAGQWVHGVSNKKQSQMEWRRMSKGTEDRFRIIINSSSYAVVRLTVRNTIYNHVL